MASELDDGAKFELAKTLARQACNLADDVSGGIETITDAMNTAFPGDQKAEELAEATEKLMISVTKATNRIRANLVELEGDGKT